MAKVKYRSVNFRDESRALIDECNVIIEDYQVQGFRLTLRQLYYQLVTKNLITNEEKSYKKMSSLLTDARYAGLVDWDAIEDRVRQPRECSEWNDIRGIVNAAVYSYRLPRWKGQKNYTELWVEKEALAGVLAPIASENHITLMVNKGYSSASAMRDAALRFRGEIEYPRGTRGYIEHRKRKLTLLYLGDHAPNSAKRSSISRAMSSPLGSYVHVRKIALTIAQVQQYNPPPNPAKITDPRAEKYIRKYGDKSWEVDALPPKILRQIIESELGKLIDRPLMDAIIARENEDKTLLRDATENLMRRDRQAPPWVDHDPGFDDDDDLPEWDGEPADPDVFVDPDADE